MSSLAKKPNAPKRYALAFGLTPYEKNTMSACCDRALCATKAHPMEST
jgi:hypothetical protein